MTAIIYKFCPVCKNMVVNQRLTPEKYIEARCYHCSYTAAWQNHIKVVDKHMADVKRGLK